VRKKGQFHKECFATSSMKLVLHDRFNLACYVSLLLSFFVLGGGGGRGLDSRREDQLTVNEKLNLYLLRRVTCHSQSVRLLATYSSSVKVMLCVVHMVTRSVH